MKHPGKRLAGRSKRELLERLRDEIAQWDGIEPLGREGERTVSWLLDLLDRCILFTQERHWFHLCEYGLAEARRKPGTELREQWLAQLSDWQDYVNDRDIFADDPPAAS
jgi:hypothetical protein